MKLIATLLLLAASLTPPLIQASSQHTEQAKQLRSSVHSLLQALDDSAARKGNQTLSLETRYKAEQLIRVAQQQLEQHPEAAITSLERALTITKIAINALNSNAVVNNQVPETQPEQEAESAFVIEKRTADINRIKTSINALMQALQRIGEEKQQTTLVREIQVQISQWQQRAETHVSQGALIQARKLLDQALVEVKTAIAGLRQNETLVRSLNFASKQEEYAYELDRFETYQLLLQVLVLPKQSLTDSSREQIEQWQQQAEKGYRNANQRAAKGEYQQAIETLESAGEILLKAIRRGGVYLPS